MISIMLTTASAVATQHKKSHSRKLFSIPLNIADGGMLGVAQRCRAELSRLKVSDRKTHIILMENVIYKEFSHMPTTQKAAAGFAALEARTVLREQAANYTVSHISFGSFKNQNGEEATLLLATPTALLKAVQTAFGANGFRIESVHSGFDAFKTACEKTVLTKTAKKSFVAIDFSLEHTLVNVYSEGDLASQRRLPGFASALLPHFSQDSDETDAQKIYAMRTQRGNEEFSQAATESIESFLWDTLRTVRVVSAPLQLEIDGFFLSGDACNNENLRNIIRNTLELPCTFADEIDNSSIWSKQMPNSLFVAGGAVFSPLDLLSQIRVEKKNAFLDVAVCVALSLIVVAGFMAQPFAIKLKELTLSSVEARYSSLGSVKAAVDTLSEYSLLLNGIEHRKAVLTEYKSNVGKTHPEVEDLFSTKGLKIVSLAYDGTNGLYTVMFVADSKEIFVNLKDKIYSNSEYFLNLSLSSNMRSETEEYDCLLTFTPSSFKPRAEIKASVPEQEPADTDILEDFTNE